MQRTIVYSELLTTENHLQERAKYARELYAVASHSGQRTRAFSELGRRESHAY